MQAGVSADKVSVISPSAAWPLRRLLLAFWLLPCWLFATAAAAGGEHFIWVDTDGVTHITGDPAAAPSELRHPNDWDWERTRALWDDGVTGSRTVTPPGASGTEADRVTRLLRAAVHDLERGERSRAVATFQSVLRLEPTRPEAHWYLALLDRQRGRYDASEAHLRSFLSRAGDDLERWRRLAKDRLRALDDERRLADARNLHGEMRLIRSESPNFRIRIDAELDAIHVDYAATALGYLEDARRQVSEKLGVQPQEPLGVVIYGRARYEEQHRHRFSFATVGFFDGRIHVASPAHPSEQLRSLLFHEYTHALFREQTGGDRPYWLNEGLAERIERSARNLPSSTHSERVALRAGIEMDSWIPLRAIARSFSGLSDSDARIAYLEAVMAAGWLEERTTREQRARLLTRLGEGFSIDQVLHELVGLDTEGLDAAIREEIRSEFPDLVRTNMP